VGGGIEVSEGVQRKRFSWGLKAIGEFWGAKEFGDGGVD